jgi:putative endonuclease
MLDFAESHTASVSPVSTSLVGSSQRQRRGATSYHAGASAENAIAQDYERRGYPVVRRRWRGKAGEIDLIVKDGDGLIFVEVKQSRTFEQALTHLTARQIGRIRKAVEEFLGTQPMGSLTEVRFDLALVNGYGESQVIENALA